ncbi:DEKNAAC101755 [Brettanomyces naardenensis]|uniref:DEKNAAC101755 n=1 Tax=Brettanomyces naardenensis TaxID=13370 RepID=A0A448YIQ2_BRENA|nr:DEKNAAC101755 [Brettanomyces naardenensis]
MVVAPTDWKLGFNAGGRLLRTGHVITPDGKFAIALFKTHIKVYSLSTRQSIRSIKLDRDLSDVVDTRLSSKTPSWLYLFTSSNEVLAVDWKDKSASDPIVKRYTLDESSTGKYGQILQFVKFIDDDESDFVLVLGRPHLHHSVAYRKSHSRHLVRFSSQTDKVEHIASVNDVILLAKSTDGNNVAFVTGGHDVYYTSIVGAKGGHIRATIHHSTFPYKTPVISVAISNGEVPLVALGTVSGVIQLLYLGQDSKKQSSNTDQRLLKWHVDEVKAVEFSSDGSYLISGGLEKVLVFWQLETEKQQFLPRLNGSICDIRIDDRSEQFYGISLELTKNSDTEERYMEYLVLNALDLTSRLDVNGIRPKFSTNLDKKLERDFRRRINRNAELDENDLTKMKYDCSSDFQIHPQSKMMYLPYGPRMQVYDVVKSDQAFVTTMAETLQQGRVRNEASIRDPSVEHFAFTIDGSWMCTFDTLCTPELDHLLSEEDVKYSLKFWKYMENSSSEQSRWELCTKIIDPHSTSVPIACIIPAPASYYDGIAFLTADTKGGVRMWRPRVPKEMYAKLGNKKLQQTAWTLRRFRNGTGRLETSSIDLSWSRDASVIALGQENAITLIDANNFETIEDMPVPSLADSRIRALDIVGSDLVVLTKQKLIAFNLLTYRMNELAVRVHSPIGARSLLAVDNDRDLICFCANYHRKTGTDAGDYSLHSRIYVFESGSLKPVYIADHSTAISCVRYSKAHSGFILLDIDSKVGILNTVTSKFLLQEEEKKQLDKAYQMSALLNNAQLVAKVSKKEKETTEDIDDDQIFNRKVLNPDVFEPILENMEGLPVEALFDRIMTLL